MMTPETNHKTAVVFDFGEVLIYWGTFLLYGPRFNNDRAAMQHFLDEIGFAEWNTPHTLTQTLPQTLIEREER